MSQAGAQVASDQFSSPEVLNGSKPSNKRLSLSSNEGKGSKPINSRAPLVGAKPAPLLFAITLPPLLIIWWTCNSIAELELSKRCAVEMRLELQGDTEGAWSPLRVFPRTGGRLYAMFAALSFTLPALWPVQIRLDQDVFCWPRLRRAASPRSRP